MDFHGVIMKGPIILERVSGSLGALTAMKGRVVYHEDTNTIYFYDGTQWVQIFDENSSIDADTLDSHHATYFAVVGHNHDADYADTDHNHDTMYLSISNNLSDVASAPTSLGNLGVTISGDEPSDAQGVNGNIWMKYE